MSELINTYKLEIEDLKSINEKLIEKNKIFYGRTKNQKRTILRLKQLISELRKSKKETISDDWDCIDGNEEL
jgi:hypothetical protein